jgi:hypothetical protein
MHQTDYFKSLDELEQQKLFNFWFKPWQYAHSEHHQGLFAGFEKSPFILQNQAYIAYCQHFHLMPLLQSFNLKWFEIHIQPVYQNIDDFKTALEMLGCMTSKRLKHHLKADALRWCYQNSLSRPIILQQDVPVRDAFELGVVIFHQMVQNFAEATWARICLVWPPNVKIKYSQTPLFAAPMLLISQKHWAKILQYIQSSAA